MFTYVASGGLSLRRCGPIYSFTPRRVRAVNFLPCEKAWLLFKAQVGIVEFVVVKKIKFFDDLLGVIYFDTFNRAYNEGDLIGETDATAIATAYIQQRIQQAQRAECS